MKRCAVLFVFFLLLFASSLSKANSSQALNHFLQGEFDRAAPLFRSAGATRLYILSLVGEKDYETALRVLDDQLKDDAFTPKGPWVEGHFLRAWILLELGKTQEAEADLKFLTGTGPDSLVNLYMNGKSAFLRKDYREAVKFFQRLSDTQHPLEHAARFYLAVSLFQSSVDDPIMLDSALEQIEWLINNESDDSFKASLREVSEKIRNERGVVVKPLDDPVGIRADLSAVGSNLAIVPDILYGIDPIITQSGFAPKANANALVHYRFLRHSVHEFFVGYSVNSTFHFSTVLYPFDHLEHGPSLTYNGALDWKGVHFSFHFKEQFVDGQTNISRMDHTLYANVNELTVKAHFSEHVATSLTGYFTYNMFQDYQSANDPTVSAANNIMMYSTEMTGLKFGGLLKQYLFFPDSFIFGFPLELTLFGGMQAQTAQNEIYARMAYHGGFEGWVPLRWDISMGLRENAALSFWSNPDRSMEIYTDSRLMLRRPLSEEAFIYLEGGTRMRFSDVEAYAFSEYNLGVRLSYHY